MLLTLAIKLFSSCCVPTSLTVQRGCNSAQRSAAFHSARKAIASPNFMSCPQTVRLAWEPNICQKIRRHSPSTPGLNRFHCVHLAFQPHPFASNPRPLPSKAYDFQPTCKRPYVIRTPCWMPVPPPTGAAPYPAAAAPYPPAAGRSGGDAGTAAPSGAGCPGTYWGARSSASRRAKRRTSWRMNCSTWRASARP